jgi:Lrp/AsnC family leucine-responsive transcriptional regulator
MDALDRKILLCLKKNAREKASAIAEQVNLSVSSVTERIKKLEKEKVIAGYTLILDDKQIGNTVSAIMEVSIENPKYQDGFLSLVDSIPSIVTCYCVTGDYDYVIHIVTDSTDGLECIYRAIRSFEGVSETKTSLILRTTKQEFSVIPE